MALFLSADIHQGDDHFSVQIYRVRVYKKSRQFFKKCNKYRLFGYL
jgi:hypothetical protein